MKDLYSNVLLKQSLLPATRTNGTVNGSAVDRKEDGCDYQAVLVLVTAGTITDGTHTIEVQDSDDGSNFTAVADAFLQGAEPAIAAADDNKDYAIGYTGLKRYVRVAVTTAGATTGGVFGAAVLLGSPAVAPVVRN
ncbi:hypothetical protein [Nonomuraea gerenzanensis]|uniref:Phage protein n=1 Tax=Nonomuraea gerenzanensis TaxID=93944 RepID=A0A1M4BKU8_9ACTN|nr:hypothetical protein [Nonomuraea gerenzanensis]UBU10026.1 hypothetical protein LCN96_37495 [Nonomuraea gerenzanensis]SAP16265.1 Phage protein [Nonomuraea gerenzanensis]